MGSIQVEGVDQCAGELARLAQGMGLTAGAATLELLERYEPLMKGVVRDLRVQRQDYEDAMQSARLGLLEALSRFDPDRGVDLGSFAYKFIRGQIVRYVYGGLPPVRLKGGMSAVVTPIITAVPEPADQLILVDPFEMVEERNDVLTFVGRLPVPDREHVFATCWGGRPQRAIAKDANVSAMSINRSLRRVYEEGRLALAESEPVLVA